MIRNRTIQLIFQTAYCSIGIVALAASLGLFNAQFENNFYVYFTNLSNYICVFVMLAELAQTAKKNNDSYTSAFPILKFMGVLMIMLTFLVFNGLLAKDRTLEQNLTVSSTLLHVVLPLMYVADWFLFYERRTIKWYVPLLSVSVPLAYAVFVFIRAWIINGEGEVVYPYFFLDVNNIGWNGVMVWIGIIFVAFVIMGYIFFLIDRLVKSPSEKSIKK